MRLRIAKPSRMNVAWAAAGFLAAAVITALVAPHLDSKRNYFEIIAVTGATPLALKEEVGRGLTLEVSGATERAYRFGSNALNAFASVCRRTLEISPTGEFEGSYRYTGIPVLHMLEGIVPLKAEGAAFDRPLDMIVAFISSDGDQRRFSYGELTMTDDRDPVMLAYARAEVLPAKLAAGEAYVWNKHRGPLRGLRLICPQEPDNSRYLDDVVKMVLETPTVDIVGLPAMSRDERCSAESITVIRNGVAAPLCLEAVDRTSTARWVRTGHGRGFKGISRADGYDLRSLLAHNFPDAGPDDFFLFVACDGYRSLFSAKEIFNTEAGRSMMLIEAIDGKPLTGGASVGPVRDYFVDRMVRGLTHIVLLDDIR